MTYFAANAEYDVLELLPHTCLTRERLVPSRRCTTWKALELDQSDIQEVVLAAFAKERHVSNPALKKVVDGAVGQQQPRPEYQSWQMPGQQQGGYGQPGQPGFGQQGFGPGGFAGGMQPGMPGFAPGQQGQAP